MLLYSSDHTNLGVSGGSAVGDFGAGDWVCLVLETNGENLGEGGSVEDCFAASDLAAPSFFRLDIYEIIVCTGFGQDAPRYLYMPSAGRHTK